MNVQEFSDAEWRDILDEFRLLVVRAGYAEWDASMAESLDDEDERVDSPRLDRRPPPPAVETLRRYAEAFMRFLKARSRHALDERRNQLGDLLRTESGTPVERFVLDIEGVERPISDSDDDPDAMIANLGQLLTELSGEDSGFWDDGTGRPDRDT